jgi:hypothetical protein
VLKELRQILQAGWLPHVSSPCAGAAAAAAAASATPPTTLPLPQLLLPVSHSAVIDQLCAWCVADILRLERHA